MMVEVLHVLGTAAPEGMALCRMLSALAGRARERGYSLSACFLSGHGPLAQRLEAEGIDVACLGWDGRATDVGGMSRFVRLCRRGRYKVVHLHVGGRAVRLSARASAARLVYHVHGRVREAEWNRLEVRSIDGVDAVIANSNATAATVRARNVRVVHAGVEPAPSAAVIQDGPPVFGTAGRLVAVKGHGVLLEAVARLVGEGHALRVEIAGDGPERIALESRARELRVQDHVAFLGWVSEVMPLFRRWHAFVMPSFEESFGLAAAEASSAGLPVIGSNVGGLSEIVADGDTGLLVRPGDATALADAMRRMLVDRTLHGRLSSAAARRAARLFSAEHMAREICTIYDELCAAR